MMGFTLSTLMHRLQKYKHYGEKYDFELVWVCKNCRGEAKASCYENQGKDHLIVEALIIAEKG